MSDVLTDWRTVGGNPPMVVGPNTAELVAATERLNGAIPALLEVAEAARLLVAMHDQMGPQFQPHDELGLRDALDRLAMA